MIHASATNKLRTLMWLLLRLVLLYLVVCLIVRFWVLPGKLFYPPRRDRAVELRTFRIPVTSTAWISAVYLPSSKAQSTILYSHGNGVDLPQLMPLLRQFQRHGYAVLAYDYEGYGRSSDKLSVAHTKRDVVAAYQYLLNQHGLSPSNIIDYGQSLGTALAVYLASKYPVASLVLQSPLLSAYRVVTHYPLLLFDVYNSASLIGDIHVPVLIIHGTSDPVIPYYHGKALFELANSPKQLITIPGGGHGVLLPLTSKPKRFWRALDSI